MWKIATTSTSVFRTLIVCSNTTLLKLQTVLFLFFPNSALPNWGCGLSTDAAYTWTFTVFISIMCNYAISQIKLDMLENFWRALLHEHLIFSGSWCYWYEKKKVSSGKCERKRVMVWKLTCNYVWIWELSQTLCSWKEWSLQKTMGLLWIILPVFNT